MIVSPETLHPRLREGDAHYYLSGEAPVVDVMKYPPEIVAQIPTLARIPHLRLRMPEFDVARATSEVAPLLGDAVHCDLRRPDESAIAGPAYQPHWAGRAIINYSRSSTEFFCKQAKESATRAHPDLQGTAHAADRSRLSVVDMNYYPTEIHARLPYVTEYLRANLAGRTFRSWIWIIRGGGYLNWHNHGRLPWHDDFVLYDKAIVHLPLITHPDALMLVRKSGLVHAQHYAPGECWLFNPVEDHAVDNSRNPRDRVHITVFCPLDDPTFCDLLRRSLEDPYGHEVMP